VQHAMHPHKTARRRLMDSRHNAKDWPATKTACPGCAIRTLRPLCICAKRGKETDCQSARFLGSNHHVENKLFTLQLSGCSTRNQTKRASPTRPEPSFHEVVQKVTPEVGV